VAARAAALFLITLILLPFTAPFPTCELSRPTHADPFDTPAKGKLTDDNVEVPLDAIVAGPHQIVVVVDHLYAPEIVPPPPPHHTVLRL
jgi:hypothetical protein